MDLRQSDLYANYMRSLDWIVERIDDTNIFIKKILFFSVIKVQRPNKLDLKKLKLIRRKYRAIIINIEPSIAGCHPAMQDDILKTNWHLLPTKTVLIDLANINIPKDTRYEIRKAENNGLKVRESKDINLFYKLLQETMNLGGWQIPIRKEVTSLYQAFQPNNSAILSTDESACMLIWSGDTAHFMYAANSKKGLAMGGAYSILNEAIKFCQKLGLKYLDLEGIYDDRYPNENKSWQGFTKFKLGWGGKVVEY